MSSASLYSCFALLPFMRLLASFESHRPMLVARKTKAREKRRWLPPVALTDLCAIAPDCQAVVLALAPGHLHVLCTQSHQLLALHRLVPGMQGMQVRSPGTHSWLTGAGSASPQLCVLGLQLQLLANQLQELPVGEVSIDSQRNCELVMHLEDMGAGDSWFSLLQAGNGMSPCVAWQAQGCGNWLSELDSAFQAVLGHWLVGSPSLLPGESSVID